MEVPVDTVKAKQPVVVAEIDYTLLILCYRPVLVPRLIVRSGVVVYWRNEWYFERITLPWEE